MKKIYYTKNLKSPWHQRGYLPHFDGQRIFQFVTFRLFDSIPFEIASKINNNKETEEAIDKNYGSCLLQNSFAADLVKKTIFSFDLTLYKIHAWVIMPNHVHLLFLQFQKTSLSLIMQKIKGSSSHLVNKSLKRTGQLWQPDYFDTYIRNEKHLCSVIEYIEYNPVKAGLCSSPKDCKYSSAFKD